MLRVKTEPLLCRTSALAASAKAQFQARQAKTIARSRCGLWVWFGLPQPPSRPLLVWAVCFAGLARSSIEPSEGIESSRSLYCMLVARQTVGAMPTQMPVGLQLNGSRRRAERQTSSCTECRRRKQKVGKSLSLLVSHSSRVPWTWTLFTWPRDAVICDAMW